MTSHGSWVVISWRVMGHDSWLACRYLGFHACRGCLVCEGSVAIGEVGVYRSLARCVFLSLCPFLLLSHTHSLNSFLHTLTLTLSLSRTLSVTFSLPRSLFLFLSLSLSLSLFLSLSLSAPPPSPPLPVLPPSRALSPSTPSTPSLLLLLTYPIQEYALYHFENMGHLTHPHTRRKSSPYTCDVSNLCVWHDSFLRIIFDISILVACLFHIRVT